MRSSGLDQSSLTPVWVNIVQKELRLFTCQQHSVVNQETWAEERQSLRTRNGSSRAIKEREGESPSQPVWTPKMTIVKRAPFKFSPQSQCSEIKALFHNRMFLFVCFLLIRVTAAVFSSEYPLKIFSYTPVKIVGLLFECVHLFILYCMSNAVPHR